MDHSHCDSCVTLGCERHDGCPVVRCSNLCGFSMHECKVQEHLEDMCSRSLVPCVNATFGCELKMERRKLGAHVQHCPASVLVCRYPAPYDQRPRAGGDDANALTLTEMLAPACKMLVRRDEVSGHIQTYHIDVQHSPLLYRRCPMATCGCQHTQTSLVPGPRGTSVSVKLQCLFVQPPDSSSKPTGANAERLRKQRELAMYGYAVQETVDPLGQLPKEVLVNICTYLDSLALWSLSQANYYLREVCNTVMTKKGITVSTWSQQNSSWVKDPQVSSAPS